VKVLVTGSNGFVGSHLVRQLLREGYQVRALLRTTSDTRLIKEELPDVEVAYGELRAPESLLEVARGVDAVVHCAAKTKAKTLKEYYQANARGALNLVEACNSCAGELVRLVLVSSVAVTGPGPASRPAVEERTPRPISHYGRSKALGERWVRLRSRVPFTIVRPAAVYGPGDSSGFLMVFDAVRRGWMPLIDGGLARTSLIYVADLARGILAALRSDAAVGQTYHLAHPRPCSQRQLQENIARAMGVMRPRRVFFPHLLLYPICLLSELRASLTGQVSMVNLQKIPELVAPGWVCSARKASDELGFTAGTPLSAGVRETLRWYVDNGWLSA